MTWELVAAGVVVIIGLAALAVLIGGALAAGGTANAILSDEFSADLVADERQARLRDQQQSVVRRHAQ